MENNTPNQAIIAESNRRKPIAIIVVVLIVLAVILIRVKNPSKDVTINNEASSTPVMVGNIEVNTTTSVLIFKAPENPVKAGQFTLASGTGAKGVPLLNFNLESIKGPTLLKTVTIAASGTIPVAAYLYDGATLLKKASTTGETIVFENINLDFASDQIREFTIKADFGANTPSGSKSIVAIISSDWERPNKSGFRSTFSLIGPEQTLVK